jgi:transcriptional regulator with XRE-family HTH domain
MSKIFAKRLKEVRQSKNLSQEELGKILGLTNGAISGYERNYREPDQETLQKISDILEVSLDYLLGKSNVKNIGPIQNRELVDMFQNYPSPLKNVILYDADDNIITYEDLDDDEKEDLKKQISFIVEKHNKKYGKKK